MDNIKQIPASEKGEPGGVAELDANGLVKNADGSIAGSKNEIILFSDTTTNITSSGYVKKIPLSINAKGGTLKYGRSVATGQSGSLATVHFSKRQEDAIGFWVNQPTGQQANVGVGQYPNNLIPYQFSGNNYGIRLMNAHINSNNELELEFKSDSPTGRPLDLVFARLEVQG